MKFNKGISMIIIIGLTSFSLLGQSLSTLSNEELEAKKKEAVASENFELANQIKAEQNARKSIDDKLIEKNEELKTTLANEDFEKAEQLKKEIAQLEEDKAKLIELEEDRKIAMFEERYTDVIDFERKISNLKAGIRDEEVAINNNTQNLDEVTKQLLQMPPADFAKSHREKQKEMLLAKNESHKQDLINKPYNTKIVGSFHFGFKRIKPDVSVTSPYYDESEMILNYHLSNSRWWINKYIAGGTFFDFAFGDYFSYNLGGQMTAYGDFDSFFVPYASFGFGFGYREENYDIKTSKISQEEGNYIPFVFRLGANVFFNKQRSIGIKTEFAYYTNNVHIPRFNIGLVWTRMKRKDNTWIQNKK